MRVAVFACVAMAAGAAVAQQSSKDAFMRQQAYAEMQRVSGQVDVLQNNIDDLQRKVSRLESAKANDSIRAELDALKASVSDLRTEMRNMRQEIVRDLSARLSKISVPEKPAPQKPSYTGPCQEYKVRSGDTLFVVAMAFKTTVQKIREMNGLKSDVLRVGQTLLVPKVSD